MHVISSLPAPTNQSDCFLEGFLSMHMPEWNKPAKNHRDDCTGAAMD